MHSLAIVTPTLNSGHFFEQTAASVRILKDYGATYCVVDSGSTDSTLEIARRWEVPVTYCPPGNMYAAVNAGLFGMHADWLTYVNSDDIVFPDSIIDALNEYGDCADIIYGNTDYIDCSGKFMYAKKAPKEKYLSDIFSLGIMPFAQPGTLFRKSVFDKLQGFSLNYRYCSDFDFFMRALLQGFRFAYYRQSPTAAFRIHSQQLSNTMAEAMSVEAKDILTSNKIPERRALFSYGKFMHRVDNIGNWISGKLRS